MYFCSQVRERRPSLRLPAVARGEQGGAHLTVRSRRRRRSGQRSRARGNYTTEGHSLFWACRYFPVKNQLWKQMLFRKYFCWKNWRKKVAHLNNCYWFQENCAFFARNFQWPLIKKTTVKGRLPNCNWCGHHLGIDWTHAVGSQDRFK
jgi:hypothetical protein